MSMLYYSIYIFVVSDMFEVFRQYDKDFKGQIKISDLSNAMLSLGHNPTVAELDKLVNAIEREGIAHVLLLPIINFVMFYTSAIKCIKILSLLETHSRLLLGLTSTMSKF